MKSEVEKFYELISKKKQIINRNDRQLQVILKFIPHNKYCKILDAGCGNGRYSFFLSKNGYKFVYAIDLFEKIEHIDFIYKQSSIDNTNFESDFFDFIFCNSVIYYTDNPEHTLAEFHRILKKDGLIFFSAHTKYSIYTFYRILKRFFNFTSVAHLQNVVFFSANYYKNIIYKLNFQIIEQNGFSIGPPKNKWRRLIYRFKENFYALFTNSIRSEIMYHSYFVIKK
jgi:SAM-dependent methyltransferase